MTILTVCPICGYLTNSNDRVCDICFNTYELQDEDEKESEV